MILYYLKYYVETGEGPKKLIDENIASDYNKIKAPHCNFQQDAQ